MKNQVLITIDLEEAHHSNIAIADHVDPLLRINVIRKIDKGRDFQSSVQKLLGWLNEHNVKAIFFVVGETAQKYPQVIKDIVRNGHKIASHSMSHKLVYKMTQEEFRTDARKCKQVLENISGQQVIWYRAPSWSAHSKKTPWFWQVLAQEGYKYSSSIMPFKTFLYGDPNFCNLAVEPPLGGSTAKLCQRKKIDGILEIPPATVRILGKNVPYSGGFYFRILPWWFIKWATRKKEVGLPIGSPTSNIKRLIFYFHLRDIGLEKAPRGIGAKEYFIQYFRQKSGKKKFLKLLRGLPCT